VTLRPLHQDSIVVDLHCDSLIQARAVGYRLAVRHRRPLLERLGFYHADLPRMREGGVTGQFFGVVTMPIPEAGCADACRRQVAHLREVAAEEGLIWARSAEDVRRAKREGTIAVFTGIEGGHNLEGRLEELRDFDRAGVRYLGLTHFTANAIAPPSGGMGASALAPLTDFGRGVVAEMNRLGMIVDLAHVGRAAFLEACSRSTRPVIVSHTGISAVHPLWRNVDDEQLRAIARTDGVVGIIFAWRYLGRRRQGIEMLAPHFEHVRKLVGARHLALGSDFDGAIEPVRGLENVSQLPAVTGLLEGLRWSEDEIRGVLGENVLRVLEAHGSTNDYSRFQ
jgi:membrane dipeptidase